jgi:hypothetical protein
MPDQSPNRSQQASQEFRRDRRFQAGRRGTPKSAPADHETGARQARPTPFAPTSTSAASRSFRDRPRPPARGRGEERVVAVALDYAGSTLQVSPSPPPFRRPVAQIREQIVGSFSARAATPRRGPFGLEVRAEIPAPAEASRGSSFPPMSPRWATGFGGLAVWSVVGVAGDGVVVLERSGTGGLREPSSL